DAGGGGCCWGCNCGGCCCCCWGMVGPTEGIRWECGLEGWPEPAEISDDWRVGAGIGAADDACDGCLLKGMGGLFVATGLLCCCPGCGCWWWNVEGPKGGC